VLRFPVRGGPLSPSSALALSEVVDSPAGEHAETVDEAKANETTATSMRRKVRMVPPAAESRQTP
jgi:hypothetical protein